MNVTYKRVQEKLIDTFDTNGDICQSQKGESI